MLSEEKTIVLRVVEHYARTGNIDDGTDKATLLPENKTSAVELIGDQSRSILLDKYNVDGKTIWAGYSVRSGVVFLSVVRSY